jgi:hypothetical protein
MDQVRIIIIASVIFFMIATLTLLNRFSKKPEVVPDRQVTEKVKIDSGRNSTVKIKKVQTGSTKWKPPESVKFSPPPKHIFAVEDSEAFVRESKKFKSQGKVIE